MLQLLADQIQAEQEHSKEVVLQLTLAAYTSWALDSMQDLIPLTCREKLVEAVSTSQQATAVPCSACPA